MVQVLLTERFFGFFIPQSQDFDSFRGIANVQYGIDFAGDLTVNIPRTAERSYPNQTLLADCWKSAEQLARALIRNPQPKLHFWFGHGITIAHRFQILLKEALLRRVRLCSRRELSLDTSLIWL